MRWYIDACRTLHQTGLPIIGQHTGTVGLLLMALGAVGGIECGITEGETFDIEQRIRRPRVPRNGKPMGSAPRVYLTSLQTFLTPKEAQAFFGTRGMTGQHVCQGCCGRGVQDMLSNPINHFILSRASEVRRLSDYPLHRRARLYLDEVLRPACDRAVAATRAHPKMLKARTRLDAWRQAYTGFLDSEGGDVRSVAVAPTGRRVRPPRAG
jgi:hypothetical protein